MTARVFILLSGIALIFGLGAHRHSNRLPIDPRNSQSSKFQVPSSKLESPSLRISRSALPASQKAFTLTWAPSANAADTFWVIGTNNLNAPKRTWPVIAIVSGTQQIVYASGPRQFYDVIASNTLTGLRSL